MGCAAASRGGRVEHKRATLGGDPSQDPRWRNSAAAPTSDGEAARVATRPGPQRKLPQKGYRPPRYYISPCGIGGASFFSSGRSVISASLVSRSDAMDAPFSPATRSTLVGALIP